MDKSKLRLSNLVLEKLAGERQKLKLALKMQVSLATINRWLKPNRHYLFSRIDRMNELSNFVGVPKTHLFDKFK